jgi:serpin B
MQFSFRSVRVAILGALCLTGLATMTHAQTSQPSADVKKLAADTDAFAADLYSRLAGEKGNLFFSPYSIESALGMTYGGARGETASQMAGVLHFSLPPDQLNAAAGELMKSLETSGTVDGKPGFDLVVANALWGQKGYPYQPAFLNLVSRDYGASLETVDFAQFELVRQQINAWVGKQTHDKIKELIQPANIDANTRLVLTNAIYFKGAWAEPFKKELTKEEPFHLGADRTAQVELMHQQHAFPYMETDDMQAVELPYKGQRLTMVLLLPKKVDGLAALEKQLTPEAIDGWVNQLHGQDVELSLPKFTMTCKFELSDTLKAMGMTDAFSGKADFSGISSAEGMAISKVIHKAFVDVNEEGTEAAAATAIVMRPTGVFRRPAPPVVFRADHPFVFMIRDRETGAILFVGRLVEGGTGNSKSEARNPK